MWNYVNKLKSKYITNQFIILFGWKKNVSTPIAIVLEKIFSHTAPTNNIKPSNRINILFL